MSYSLLIKQFILLYYIFHGVLPCNMNSNVLPTSEQYLQNILVEVMKSFVGI